MSNSDDQDDDGDVLPPGSLSRQLRSIRRAIEAQAAAHTEAAASRVTMAQQIAKGLEQVGELDRKVVRLSGLLESQDDENPGLRRRVRDLEEAKRRAEAAQIKRERVIWGLICGGGLVNAGALIIAVLVISARFATTLEPIMNALKRP